MVGVQKECRTCKKLFITRSSNSARWETQCFECYNERKKTKQMISFQERETNVVSSLEDRIIKVEKWMDNIPSIIGAEVNNNIQAFIGEDLLGAITKTNDEKIAKLFKELKETHFAFQEKVQKQIVMINNRIIAIMKEFD